MKIKSNLFKNPYNSYYTENKNPINLKILIVLTILKIKSKRFENTYKSYYTELCDK